MINSSPSIHDLIYGRQYNRILRLSFPHNDAPSAQFLVNKLDLTESLSKHFEFKVELLCDDANIPLKEMQGKLLNIELVRRDGSLAISLAMCSASAAVILTATSRSMKPSSALG
jgi:type VI secretion system secreted protein VgrG